MPLIRACGVHPHLTEPVYRLVLRSAPTSFRKRVYDTGEFRINIDLTEFVDAKLYFQGEYEPELCGALRLLLCPGDVAIDVGANIGVISLLMAHLVGPRGRVLAFEASSWAVERLRANISLNHFQNVDVVCAAIGAVDAHEIEIVVPNGYPLMGGKSGRRQRVPGVCLGGYAQRNGATRVDLIKCDTDGWEDHVFQGAEAILEASKPALVFEFGPADLRAAGSSPESLLRRLEAHGYEVREISPGFPRLDPVRRQKELEAGGTVNLVAAARPDHLARLSADNG